jgi:hypothetical protein
LSIGIGLIIPGGVILIADGRQGQPQSLNPHVVDNANKVVSLSDHIFAIPFGVVQATDIATLLLKSDIKQNSSHELIQDVVDTSIREAWNQFLKKLASDVNINHPTMRAALIVGGLSQDCPFIAASLHGSGVTQKPILIKDSFQFIVFGGEEYEANIHFANQLRVIVKKDAWSFSEGPHNRNTKGILQAANNTIRYIESLDSSIGGIIRYAIIRKGFPVAKEVYNRDNQENM